MHSSIDVRLVQEQYVASILALFSPLYLKTCFHICIVPQCTLTMCLKAVLSHYAQSIPKRRITLALLTTTPELIRAQQNDRTDSGMCCMLLAVHAQLDVGQPHSGSLLSATKKLMQMMMLQKVVPSLHCRI